jgi:hypothetical protein
MSNSDLPAVCATCEDDPTGEQQTWPSRTAKSSLPELALLAAGQLARNTHKGFKDGQEYLYTVPANGRYPHQWSGWDSQAIVIARARIAEIARAEGLDDVAALEIENAKAELRSMFAWQFNGSASQHFGFIPHVIFWDKSKFRRSPVWWNYWESRGGLTFLPGTKKPDTSMLMQPPLLAHSVERVWRVSRDREFLAEALLVLDRYFSYYARARDPYETGLISVVNQFEAGTDFMPHHDAAVGAFNSSYVWLQLKSRWPEIKNKLYYDYDLRRILEESGYQQKDVLVNCVYISGLNILGRLAQELRVSEQSHRPWLDGLIKWARCKESQARKALIELCYDEKTGFFWNRVGVGTGRILPKKVKTLNGLMPLMVPEMPHGITERLVEHLTSQKEFWAPYPVPTTAMDESAFTRDNRLDDMMVSWRGPVTMITNWMLRHGLALQGYDDLGSHIARTSVQAFMDHGRTFVEYRDPITGHATKDAKNFSWDTLLVDM